MANSLGIVAGPDPPLPVARTEVSLHLVSGSIAGLASAVLLQPLDLLKTRLQQQHTRKASIATEIAKMAQYRDLWRGTLPSALRTLCGAGLYFTILSKTRELWARNYSCVLLLASASSPNLVLPVLLPWENLLIGSFTRGAVGLMTMPITVIKTRFESNAYNYSSILDSVRGIYQDQTGAGQLRNFFKGSVATLARDCPYAGLYVLFYEGFKNGIVNQYLTATAFHDLGLINSVSAVLAASMATTLTAPFDAIKTRVQLSNSTVPSLTIAETTKILLREQGRFRNLFSGLSLRLSRKAISAGISWFIYEELIKSGTAKSVRLR